MLASFNWAGKIQKKACTHQPKPQRTFSGTLLLSGHLPPAFCAASRKMKKAISRSIMPGNSGLAKVMPCSAHDIAQVSPKLLHLGSPFHVKTSIPQHTHAPILQSCDLQKPSHACIEPAKMRRAAFSTISYSCGARNCGGCVGSLMGVVGLACRRMRHF